MFSQPVPEQGHLVCLPSVAIINNVAVNNLIHTPCGSQGRISIGQIPGLGTVGSKGACICHFDEECCQVVFHSLD